MHDPRFPTPPTAKHPCLSHSHLYSHSVLNHPAPPPLLEILTLATAPETDAGRAYATLQTWLSGAALTTAAIDPAGDWQIGLTRPAGQKALIVWNPGLSCNFALPAGFAPSQSIGIFGHMTPVSGPTVPVGISPVLLQ